MEEKPGNRTPILIARSVVCPNDNKVVMHLLNPGSQSVTLRASSCIVQLTEPDAISAHSKTPSLAAGECSLLKKQAIWKLAEDCGPELTLEEQRQLYRILLQYSDIFSETWGALTSHNMKFVQVMSSQFAKGLDKFLLHIKKKSQC